MGAWGTGNFDNDDAWDWVNEFIDEPGLPIVIRALTTIAEANADSYLELPVCGAGIAAAEVVAALNKHPNPELPEDLAAWVIQQPALHSPQLTSLAAQTVRRIEANSEMQEAWEETESGAEFQRELRNLVSRIGGRATEVTR